MVKVLAVNNYPGRERFERVTRCLKECGATVSAIPWDESSTKKFDAFDGVVLSGSPDMMSDTKTQTKFRAEIEAIGNSKVPILGICFGHQMIAHAFGSAVVKDRESVLKFVKTRILRASSLFEGLPSSLMLLESRHEIVNSLPEDFELLATSETSLIAAMQHTKRELFGVQSHPERYSKGNPEGAQVVGNFVSLIR